MRAGAKPDELKATPDCHSLTTGIIKRLPLFWRFQIGGWLAFMAFSFPLNSVVLADVPNSIIFSASRDGLGFFLTLGMREIYRRL